MNYTETAQFAASSDLVNAETATESSMADTCGGLCAACFSTRHAAPAWMGKLARQVDDIATGSGAISVRLRHLAGLFASIDELYRTGAPEMYINRASDAQAREERAVNLACGFSTLYAQAARVLESHILPELARAGIRFRRTKELEGSQLQWAHARFLREFYPILTPLAVDPGRPFPYISSGSLNLLVALQTPEQVAWGSPNTLYARVKIPRSGTLMLPLPHARQGGRTAAKTTLRRGDGFGVDDVGTGFYVWASDLVRFYIHELFPGMAISDAYLFRVLRAPQAPTVAEDTVAEDTVAEEIEWSTYHGRQSEWSTYHGRQIDEDEHRFSYRRTLSDHDAPEAERRLRIAQRHNATPVLRLEVEAGMPDSVVQWLARHLQAPVQGIVAAPRALELFNLPIMVERLAARTAIHAPRKQVETPTNRGWAATIARYEQAGTGQHSSSAW